ncbi:MAG: OmpH family outer membrane protein [Bacteroidales bacterium]|jgi:outer membrane protein|nr:OmpH family outer membrane protein [Bacteroidales bacterium]MDD4394770.1 OmpH family outer membrane protein [Bacteroidales bacterium]
MKKNIQYICFIAVLILSSSAVNLSAQGKVKFGHLDYEAMLLSMPGVDTAQNQINQLRAELEAEATQMQNEFQTKYEDFNRKQATYSQAVAQVKQQELETMYTRIQTFSETAQNTLLTKQSELLAPIQKRLKDAITEIGKENHYTYIFDTASLSFYADSEDITAQVKLKLGIQ